VNLGLFGGFAEHFSTSVEGAGTAETVAATPSDRSRQWIDARSRTEPRASLPSDALLKLARAGEHIAAVKDLADDWLETDDFKIERFRRADGRTEVRVRLAAPPPPEIAVIAGEAVHCLRSALDNAVFASALYAAGGTLDEKTERDLEFPVVGTGIKADFDRLAKRKLAGVPEAVRHVVEEAQPYHFNDSRPGAYVFHWVWTVHDLDRIDKHRRLAVTAAAVRHAAVGIPDGIEPEVKFFHFEGPVVHDQLIASWLADHLGVEFLHDRGVTLAEGPRERRGNTIGETLHSLFAHILWIVRRIEVASGAPAS
jgi:hypothetical protein